MGYIISDLKAQYYPTDRRICDYFTYLHYPIEHENIGLSNIWIESDFVKKAKKDIEEYENYMKTNIYKFKKDWFKIPDYSAYQFQKDIIEQNNLKNIEKYKINNNKVVGSGSISQVDLFAGKGEWLSNYNKFWGMNKICYNSNIKTLGVELVKERADYLKENKIDYYYNCAFEDIDIPQESISLLLFNPPYATDNGERLTKKYLKEIINKNLLIQCESMVDFVIREDDFIDCLDLILNHFNIIKESVFKAPNDEFNKFKQIIFTARYKYRNPLPLDTKWLIQEREDTKKRLIESLTNLKSIDLTKISNQTMKSCKALTRISFEKMMESIKFKKNNKNKISDKKDLSWRWFKDLTQVEDNVINKITMPKPPKDGEIINIISSGFLNQQIDNHVVVGGVEQVEEKIKSIKIDKIGIEREQIEARKLNKPFMNVLLPNGTIKKLLSKTEGEIE